MLEETPWDGHIVDLDEPISEKSKCPVVVALNNEWTKWQFVYDKEQSGFNITDEDSSVEDAQNELGIDELYVGEDFVCDDVIA